LNEKFCFCRFSEYWFWWNTNMILIVDQSVIINECTIYFTSYIKIMQLFNSVWKRLRLNCYKVFSFVGLLTYRLGNKRRCNRIFLRRLNIGKQKLINRKIQIVFIPELNAARWKLCNQFPPFKDISNCIDIFLIF